MKKTKGYYMEKDTIVINKKLTELDIFVMDFLDILKKYSDYLIVSGYVSICTGRTRGTEDVDVIVPVMDESKFKLLFSDLTKNGFWCYQGDDSKEIYQYIKQLSSIRFARVNELFPNMEFVPFDHTKKAKLFEFTHPQNIKIGNFVFKIPQIEFEIIYKEIFLTSKKDIEDAKHLRTFFADILDSEKFKESEKVIMEEIRK